MSTSENRAEADAGKLNPTGPASPCEGDGVASRHGQEHMAGEDSIGYWLCDLGASTFYNVECGTDYAFLYQPLNPATRPAGLKSESRFHT